VAKLQGDISDLTAKLGSAERQLKNPDLTKTRRAAIEANIDQLEKQIASARAQLNAINGKTVYTEIVTTQSYQPINHGLTNLPGNAAGTASAPPGWAWVGERGPELMRFRGGEQVLPHTASVAKARSMASLSSLGVPSVGSGASLPGVSSPLRGGQLQLGVTYTGPSGDAIAAIVSGLQYHILGATGGDAQAALGRGPVRL